MNAELAAEQAIVNERLATWPLDRLKVHASTIHEQTQQQACAPAVAHLEYFSLILHPLCYRLSTCTLAPTSSAPMHFDPPKHTDVVCVACLQREGLVLLGLNAVKRGSLYGAPIWVLRQADRGAGQMPYHRFV